MNKKDLANFLYKMFYDETTKTIDLSELDFTEYGCDVSIGKMQVDGNLSQDYQKVKGTLWQRKQEVGGNLLQDKCEVNGEIWQNKNVAKNGFITDKGFKTDPAPSKLNKEELAEYLYDNYYSKNKNEIDLSELDFTKYDCNVTISDMKVKRSLGQRRQQVGRALVQNFQKVGGRLSQNVQEVKGDLYQGNQKVNGELWQDEQNVGESLFQDHQTVGGNIFQGELFSDRKLDKAELAQYLYDNYYDEDNNVISLNDLDFKKFDCNVNISCMKVKRDLYQNNQKVDEHLYQQFHEVKKNLYQRYQAVYGNLYQDVIFGNKNLAKLLYDNFYDTNRKAIDLSHLDFSEYNCDVDISSMVVDGDLKQCRQRVKGKLLQDEQMTNNKLSHWNKGNCGYITLSFDKVAVGNIKPVNLPAEEKRDWILKNCINEFGNVDLTGLDFSDFDISVFLSEMKVSRHLWQNKQEVGKSLWQGNQKVKEELWQNGNISKPVNLSAEEKRNWILQNCIDKFGDVDLRNLDFSEFDGDVHTSKMKVKCTLWQHQQEVNQFLWQSKQVVGEDLYQHQQQVEKQLCQGEQEVGEDLHQEKQNVKGYLWQGKQQVGKDLYQGNQTVKGGLW